MRLSLPPFSSRAVAPNPGLSSLLQLHRPLTFAMNSLSPSCLCSLAGHYQQEFG